MSEQWDFGSLGGTLTGVSPELLKTIETVGKVVWGKLFGDSDWMVWPAATVATVNSRVSILVDVPFFEGETDFDC